MRDASVPFRSTLLYFMRCDTRKGAHLTRRIRSSPKNFSLIRFGFHCVVRARVCVCARGASNNDLAQFKYIMLNLIAFWFRFAFSLLSSSCRELEMRERRRRRKLKNAEAKTRRHRANGTHEHSQRLIENCDGFFSSSSSFLPSALGPSPSSAGLLLGAKFADEYSFIRQLTWPDSLNGFSRSARSR